MNTSILTCTLTLCPACDAYCIPWHPQEGGEGEEEGDDDEEADTTLDVSVAADRSFIDELKMRGRDEEDDEDENGGVCVRKCPPTQPVISFPLSVDLCTQVG